MKILFICKYNKFRSRVANSYFNRINKDKNNKSQSAGLIKGRPLNMSQIQSAKKLGIDIGGTPRGLSTKLLIEADMVIIVANDVPASIFNNKKYCQNIIVWRIPDTDSSNKKEIERLIKLIMKKVEKLIKNLEKSK